MSCLFCGENEDLIDLNKNSVIIESVYIEFYDLIYDLFRLKVSKQKFIRVKIRIPIKFNLIF